MAKSIIMKLLIITQKVHINDPILGFFHRWIEEFAKHCEQVVIVCLYKGEYNFPKNVKVLSLGKEGGVNRFKYLFRFYKYIWQERNNYDSVFVHMNPIYVVLAGILWRLMNKRIALWYTHKWVDLKLRIANILTHRIFSASSKSFRLETNKIKIIGHGIDTDRFSCDLTNVVEKKIFKIITIGRISPIKDYETLLEGLNLIRGENIPIVLEILGVPIYRADENYLKFLKKKIKKMGMEDIVNFAGPVPNREVISYLCGADLFVNMSNTGSLDKAILEAMACGLPVLTSNASFRDVVEQTDFNECFFQEKDFNNLADKFRFFINLDQVQRKILGTKLREVVVKRHNIGNLIFGIINDYETSR